MNGPDLLAAVDYARRQPGVSVVSMSWGGAEFARAMSRRLDLHDARGSHRRDIRGLLRRLRLFNSPEAARSRPWPVRLART